MVEVRSSGVKSIERSDSHPHKNKLAMDVTFRSGDKSIDVSDVHREAKHFPTEVIFLRAVISKAVIFSNDWKRYSVLVTLKHPTNDTLWANDVLVAALPP